MKKREVRIYCPKCEWESQPSSRWWCGTRTGGCGCEWNTFDTAGVCPDCGRVWEETACLACRRMSAHRAWYHEFVTEASEVAQEAFVQSASQAGGPHRQVFQSLPILSHPGAKRCRLAAKRSRPAPK